MPRINKELYPRTPLFLNLAKGKDAEGDKNACAVIAVCAVAGTTFASTNKLFEKHGRKKGKGTRNSITRNVLNELGYRIVTIDPRTFINKYPEIHRRALKSVTNHHPDRFPNAFQDGRSYLFQNSDHIFAVINGVVHDHSRGTRRKVLDVWEVIKKN